MRKKLISATLCVAMAATLFTGCDILKNKEDKPSVYYLNIKPEQGEAWEALAAKYTEETGVEVKIVTAASGSYEKTLKSEMDKDEVPTLFQVNGSVGLANWKDYCYDLKDTEIYKQVKSDDFVLKDGEEVKGIVYAIETYGLIYNKKLLAQYCELKGAKIKKASDINSFAKLKKVAEDIQARKAELGVNGAFTSAGMSSSSDWRFKTHLANIPIYYEYKADGIKSAEAIKGTYLKQYKQIWDLYINNSTCDPKVIANKTGEEALSEFTTGKAVFYQSGTWDYANIRNSGFIDKNLGMLPIYIGVKGEEKQGLCTGTDNYWCVNSKASEKDIEATIDFMNWCVTSDAGRDAMANEMGFVTPFKSFDDGYVASNPLIQAEAEYIEAGKTTVTWDFVTIPSEAWKNNVGIALLAYAQGTTSWKTVERAFVDGWVEKY